MDPVRIRRIQVEKLFGRINYDIEIPEDNPVSIITAPNGMGKTTILNLITLLFSPQADAFKAVYAIPFSFIRCILSNGFTVELHTKPAGTFDKSIKNKAVQRIVNDQFALSPRYFFKTNDFIFRIYRDEKHDARISYQGYYMETFGTSPSDYIEDDDDDETPFRGQISPLTRLKNVWRHQNKMLEDYQCIISVNYIRADRIQPKQEYSRRYRTEYGDPVTVSPLKKACDIVSDRILQDTAIYSDVVSKAKDTLPQLFLDVSTKEDENADVFMDEWSKYRMELNQFQEIGLIPPTVDFTEGRDIASVYEEKGTFLSTYLKAFKPTTEPLKDIYARLNLFKSILDERNSITGKKVSINRGRIELIAYGQSVPLDSLSSGEKHDFIMFYNLIFNSPNGSLILIDEPEISLHIEWQESYLDRLSEICEMNGLKAIVATHSPHIVSSHYDWLVDKGESEG